MADTVSYPLFSDRVAGRAHLRVYSTDLEASRTADVAALADELLDAGFDVTVAAHHTPSVVAAIGRGWNEPRLTVRYVTSLVSLTAALYEAWARDDAAPAVIVEDLMSLVTGPDGGHDDTAMTSWLLAARTGDAEALFSLTGLSYPHYVRRVDPPTPVGAALFAGCRIRRGGSADELRSIMGGYALVAGADTVTAVEVHPTAPPVHRFGQTLVLGTARVLKSRMLPAPAEVPLERSAGAGRWRAA